MAFKMKGFPMTKGSSGHRQAVFKQLGDPIKPTSSNFVYGDWEEIGRKVDPTTGDTTISERRSGTRDIEYSKRGVDWNVGYEKWLAAGNKGTLGDFKIEADKWKKSQTETETDTQDRERVLRAKKNETLRRLTPKPATTIEQTTQKSEKPRSKGREGNKVNIPLPDSTVSGMYTTKVRSKKRKGGKEKVKQIFIADEKVTDSKGSVKSDTRDVQKAKTGKKSRSKNREVTKIRDSEGKLLVKQVDKIKSPGKSKSRIRVTRRGKAAGYTKN